MALISADQALYDVDERGRPTLWAVGDDTGFVSVPFQELGSERTGAYGAGLSRVALSGRGRVQAVATVNHYRGDDIAVPFTVAAIVLDEGPLVCGILAQPDSATAGDRVEATTIVAYKDGSELAELRFTVHPSVKDRS
jgi:uncharacterized OB-fold protein